MPDNEPTKKKSDTHFQALKEKVEKHLNTPPGDEMLIIKAHLICENYLDQILILNKQSTAKELPRLTFKEKLDKTSLRDGTEFEKQCYELTNQLNKIRNRIGHELEYKITESDVDSMGYILGEEYILEKYEQLNLKKLLIYCIKQPMLMLSIILETNVKEKEKLPTL